MSWKVLGVGAVAAMVFVAIQSPGIALAVLAVGGLLSATVVAVGSAARRGPMMASGVIVACVIASELAFGHDVILLGFPGFFVASALFFGVDGQRRAVEVAAVVVYWLVNTALLGMVISALRSRIGARRTGYGTAAALACALALGGTSCLTDTPPKTPNQRDAERNAPVVAVPPPPDAGRTPRPAPQ